MHINVSLKKKSIVIKLGYIDNHSESTIVLQNIKHFTLIEKS